MTHPPPLPSPLSDLESLLAEDPGGRGIAGLIIPGELERACELLVAAERVILVTGFWIPECAAPETDGPPGAFALAAALLRLGKEVRLVSDTACAAHLPVFSSESGPVAAEPAFGIDVGWADCLVAVERLGRAADGRYYSMRGHDHTLCTEPLDDWFLTANERSQVTIGIGDGGNEIGMGKVLSRVVEHIPYGATIATLVPTDALVVAGTSNWGSWGLCAAMAWRTGRANLFPSRAEAEAALRACVATGCVDGVLGTCSPSVDGLDWESYLAKRDALGSWLKTSLEETPP